METFIPFSEIPSSTCRQISVVFCDIDDTLTFHGKLLAETYKALWRLKKEGIYVVPITGRCAGWVDQIARLWPVKGVVGENGALYAYLDDSVNPSKLRMIFYQSKQEIEENRHKFEKIKEEIFNQISTLALASDQPYRLFDMAVDFCEDVPPHSKEQINQIEKIFHKFGATTKVSSIHVNGWFGDFNKLKMTQRLSRELLKLDLTINLHKALFIGDSPNDQPMFEFFPNSVGVANIRRFQEDMKYLPKYITNQEAGKGFSEMVDLLIQKRNQ
ncbi:MAG: HAD-IIB family hydrolase [Candidatus Lokiarchaeota archaeon]|nr:HAD-IIB family hydrolase [Candidatus Harpocratesius repetitus]